MGWRRMDTGEEKGWAGRGAGGGGGGPGGGGGGGAALDVELRAYGEVAGGGRGRLGRRVRAMDEGEWKKEVKNSVGLVGVYMKFLITM